MGVMLSHDHLTHKKPVVVINFNQNSATGGPQGSARNRDRVSENFQSPGQSPGIL